MLLAAGDLTFNGEKLSHETVAGLFEEIEAAGVPVLTLPGNHDVNNGMPTAIPAIRRNPPKRSQPRSSGRSTGPMAGRTVCCGIPRR